LDNSIKISQGRKVPIGILEPIEPFIERPIVVRVAVTEHDVVDVAQAPDELPLGVAGRFDALLEDLPAAALGVIEVSGFRERA
jgi:hypothetical protein